MLEYYPTLVEAAVEFRVHSRKLMAQYNSKYIYEVLKLGVDTIYVIQPEHETISLANGYRIEKDLRTG